MTIEITQEAQLIRVRAQADLLTPAEAFAYAEQLCATAYAIQDGPASEDRAEDRENQQEARNRRNASSFENLYCLICNIADDWHHEAVRRHTGKESGLYDGDMLDANKAKEVTMQTVLSQIKDWDY